ncbi:MAG: LamG domain-containing protein [Lentisphaerae bacterium]|nr:LamG domain-containing protein [Lentisphaerota bacterium]
MKKSLIMFGALLAVSVCAAEVDEHTLFHCSFDEKLEADSAAGSTILKGHASITENNGGKSGEALIMKYDQCISPSEISGQYKFLIASPKDNINVKSGTLEMWIKMGDQAEKMPRAQIFSYLAAFTYTDMTMGQKSEWANLRISYHHFTKPQWTIQMELNDKHEKVVYKGADWMKNHPRSIILKHDITDWVSKKDWHHVAVTWEGKMVQLFIDGKLVDSQMTRFNGLLNTPVNTFYIGGQYGQSNMALPCFIDEFQISDIVRYKTDFTPGK